MLTAQWDMPGFTGISGIAFFSTFHILFEKNNRVPDHRDLFIHIWRTAMSMWLSPYGPEFSIIFSKVLQYGFSAQVHFKPYSNISLFFSY